MLNFFKKKKKSEEVKNKPSLRDRLFKSKKKLAEAENLAKISIVGTGMQDSPGYASTMFKSLAEAKINIEMITTSEIRITCIIGSDQVAKAAEVLHAAFELEKPD